MESPPTHDLVPVERIRQVLNDNLSKSTPDRILPRFQGDLFEDVERNYVVYTAATEDWDTRVVQIRDFSMKLLAATEDPRTHVEKLDEALMGIVRCNFIVQTTAEETCDGARRLLNRLPPLPTALPDAVDGLPHGFFLEGKQASWQNLRVVPFLSTNTIRAVLLSTIYTNVGEVQNAVNVLAEILDTASEISQYNITETERNRWIVVRAFLWNTWQRMLMVMNERRLRLHVKFGYNHEDVKENWTRPFSPCPGLSLREITNQRSMEGKASSMCTWAFELLRSESICLGMDFSLFHARYRALFEGKGARCRVDSPDPCDGTHSDHCHRFKGMVVLNQAAHDGICNRVEGQDEPKLVWGRSSYIGVEGAKAVDINATGENGPLQYRSASERTLAISHVWCHGQGGRPEEGINSCLHQRYVRLARSLDCDSYWMDTPCIPDQHQLRKEAISQINDIFADSKVVLVCDRDIMSIEARNMTLELQESILAAILVCDWNVRAWTFLEAMKGRRNIHFLCKNGVVINWRNLLQNVSEHGRIDLAALAQLAPQLSPLYGDNVRTENIGNLLSYRPASRPGDDMVIWSLLSNTEKPIYSALDFWKSQIGKTVLTGFLMSSATRLRDKGFSWAPASPYAAPRSDDAQSSADFYRAFDGVGTEFATIQKDGLHAEWWVYAFETATVKAAVNDPKRISPFSAEGRTIHELSKLRSRFLKLYRFGALLQAVSITGFQHRGDDIGKYRGKTSGTLLVVCGMLRRFLITAKEFHKSDPAQFAWTWLGVYDWPQNVPLPKFERRLDFLIC